MLLWDPCDKRPSLTRREPAYGLHNVGNSNLMIAIGRMRRNGSGQKAGTTHPPVRPQPCYRHPFPIPSLVLNNVLPPQPNPLSPHSLLLVSSQQAAAPALVPPPQPDLLPPPDSLHLRPRASNPTPHCLRKRHLPHIHRVFLPRSRARILFTRRTQVKAWRPGCRGQS